MLRLVYLSSAYRDFTDILRYLTRESGNRALSRAFVNQLQGQCRKLASLPGLLGQARPELHPDIRSVPFKGYVIFFRYEADRLEVVNVLEGHRDIIGFFTNRTA